MDNSLHTMHNAELGAHNALFTFFNRTRVWVISYGSPYEKKDTGERTKKTDVKRSGNRKIDEKEQKGWTILCTQCTTQNLAQQCTFNFFNLTRVCFISYGSPHEKK